MGDILSQAAKLLSVPPGNLVYHLVIVVVLYNALMAIGVGQRPSRSAATTRLALTGGAILAGQATLIVAGLVAAVGITSAESLLPPLEHFVDIVSIGLFVWAFVPLAEDFPQASTVLMIGNLVIATLAYAVFAIEWYGQPEATTTVSFNGSLQDWVWTTWALVLLSLAGLALLFRRRGDWGLVGAACLVLLGGYIVHLGLDEPTSLWPGWVRLGNLAAYPILAGVMLRRVTDDALKAAPQQIAIAPPHVLPWPALEACRLVSNAPDMNAALRRAVSAIGAALNADVIALGLVKSGERQVDIVAIQQAGRSPWSGASFDLDSQPAIERAVAWQQLVIVAGGETSERTTLRALLGGGSGPLYIQPLVRDHNVSGVLIAGQQRKDANLDSQQLQHTLEGLAAELAAALTQRYKAEHLSSQLAKRDAALEQARQEMGQLEAKLAQEQSAWKDERANLAARLRDTHAELEQARRELATKEAPAPQPVASQPAKPTVTVSSRAAFAVAPAAVYKATPPESPPAEESQAKPATPPELVAETSSPIAPAAYRELFVGEALKHLDIMSSAFGRLKKAHDAEAMAQLFRSANALKSMAGAMNYTMIARLSGMLGDAIKRARAGDLDMSANLLTLSEDTSHVLRVLLEDIRKESTPSVDVAPLLERWGPFMSRAAARDSRASDSPFHPTGPTLQVRVELSPNCQLKAVRAMVVLAQLRRIGKVLSCLPDEQALRFGRIDREFVISVATDRPAAGVQTLIASIADVAQVEVR